MRYHSTNSRAISVDLRQAVMRSMAGDRGVYMPDSIPVLPKALFNNISEMSLAEIAYVAGSVLFGDDIPREIINDIVKETLNFEIPLVRVDENIWALELFHGPTGSFKDVGARFMARLIKRYLEDSDRSDSKISILVATSGDTGFAVARSFAGIKNLNVFIFHPKEKLLRVPKDDFLTSAGNIYPVAVRGSFDQCQRLVTEAYFDPEITRRLNLTSANSLNIARLLPQTFYFFHAYARLIEAGVETSDFVLSTPCGNLGNLTAALFAKQMGLPVGKILAAGRGTERLWGDVIEGRLSVNHFNQKSLSTNLSRINLLMERNPRLASIVSCHTYDEACTDDLICKMFDRSEYLMDRNSAMACKALKDEIKPGEAGVFLATATPTKYKKHLTEILGDDIPLDRYPSPIKTDISVAVKEATIQPKIESLRNLLLQHNV